ncbi:MAG: hypothetical protein RL574_1569 [Actinomycetota bacterium]
MAIRLITRPLRDFTDANVDLNDIAGNDGVLFVRDGVGFAGRGVAARIPLLSAPGFLDAVACDDTVATLGSDGVLLGWHSFDGESGEAILPEVTVAKASDGTAWVTHVEGCSVDLAPPSSTAPRATEFAVRPGVDVATYLRAVAAIRDAVQRGEITKAVVARDIFVESSEPISVHALLRRLRASFGSSYRYSIDGLVGASPELLVARAGDDVSSNPLAGTTPRTGDPVIDARLAAELRASEKNQIEHRVVIDMVHDTLLPWCSYLDWQPEPEVVAVANVQHLGTRIEGKLSMPLPHVVQLMQTLSPTPALGGHPRAAALALLAQHEGLARGRYGGSVGWCDRHGNGTWAVTIRCAELSADRRVARLFAGGGIVAQSDPQAELAETQAKFQAMLAAIVRP